MFSILDAILSEVSQFLWKL